MTQGNLPRNWLCEVLPPSYPPPSSSSSSSPLSVSVFLSLSSNFSCLVILSIYSSIYLFVYFILLFRKRRKKRKRRGEEEEEEEEEAAEAQVGSKVATSRVDRSKQKTNDDTRRKWNRGEAGADFKPSTPSSGPFGPYYPPALPRGRNGLDCAFTDWPLELHPPPPPLPPPNRAQLNYRLSR